jgi:hypothetical protein
VYDFLRAHILLINYRKRDVTVDRRSDYSEFPIDTPEFIFQNMLRHLFVEALGLGLLIAIAHYIFMRTSFPFPFPFHNQPFFFQNSTQKANGRLRKNARTH